MARSGVGSPPGLTVLPSREAEVLQRVLATPAFARSTLLSKFLLYICDRKFSGRNDEITEYQIGVQALGRSASYNPGEDNIVRNYARILRKRLEEYFASEGRDEPVRIVIPVGHYVPAFEPNIAPDTERSRAAVASDPRAEADVTNAEAPQARKSSHRSQRVLAAATFLTVLCIAASVYLQHRSRSSSVCDIFWRQIFSPNRVTYLVPGDSGLAMMQEITGKEIHLNDYIAGDLDEEFQDFNLAAARGVGKYGFDRVSNFTSKADLSIAAGIGRVAQSFNGQLKVCYSRSMNLESFKGSNAILVGGPRANPWVEMFEPESNFRMYFPMHADGIHLDERTFINKHPRAGEQPAYVNVVRDGAQLSYALLSFLPEPEGGHVILLEGQGMAGTQAAGDFLLNANSMRPILKKAQLADGTIGPFEVLLEARTVGSDSVQSRVVIERFGVAKNSQ